MAILGIDEVGRGPLAGPLVVGVCVFKTDAKKLTATDAPLAKLTDSKKLTAKQREELAKVIPQYADYALGWVPANRLDEIGISAALKEATRMAVQQIQTPFHEIIIDGISNFLQGTKLEKHTTTLKKADLLIPEVSAAAIMAKVARDNYMIKLAETYPEYGFDQHVGYGTKKHLESIEKFGPCPEHRLSFRPLSETTARKSTKNNTTRTGHAAESAVADFLVRDGHQIVARNWKTPACEIDLVSQKGDHIYFTEVKYRQNNSRGGGFQAVDNKKHKRMTFAAEVFLAAHKNQCQNLLPLLAVASVSGIDFSQIEFLVLDR